MKVEFDTRKCANRLRDRIDGVQEKLDWQVLKDSNFYCPKDTGELEASSVRSTDFGSGELIWDTPYAKAQYYGLQNKSRDSNPNAVYKWFEAAKSTKLQEWLRLANGQYNK